MHTSAMTTARAFFAAYWQPGYRRILDVGSRDVNGSLREVAPEAAVYIGVDMVAGPGVDQVIDDSLKLPFADGDFDVLVSSSCLEHDPCFWLTVAEMARVVRPGGLIYLNMPSNGPYHGYPGDHWRFYPDSGPALAGWLQRLGWSVCLAESFIAPMCPDSGWVDAVVVLARTPLLCPLPEPRLWQRLEGTTHVRETDRPDHPVGQGGVGQDPFRHSAESPPLSERRDPRSAISPRLLSSIQRGTLAYRYRGLLCLKSPFDLALYSLLIDRVQPATLIELGSFQGRVRALVCRSVAHTQSADDDPLDRPITSGTDSLAGLRWCGVVAV
jgi:SAM-dependent methyltransferase